MVHTQGPRSGQGGGVTDERCERRLGPLWKELREMARADGYVMVRHLDSTPFIMPESEWQRLPPATPTTEDER